MPPRMDQSGCGISSHEYALQSRSGRPKHAGERESGWEKGQTRPTYPASGARAGVHYYVNAGSNDTLS
jgi:hypothetical protein